MIKGMAQLMLALSRVVSSQSPAMPAIPKTQPSAVPTVLMKNGTQKFTADVSRSMKHWMNREILKVPWFGLLHSEMGKAIEVQ